VPAKSSKQYGLMQGIAHGSIKGLMPPTVAKEFVEKTPKKKRSQFAKALSKRKASASNFK
jgi:hypothetical protein